MHFLKLIDYFLSHVWKIVNYNFFRKFFSAFLFFFFIWDPYNLNVGAFNIAPKVSETFLNFFFSFVSLYSVFQQLFLPFYPQLIYSSLCLNYSAIVSFYCIFNLSNCAIHLCLLIIYLFYVLGDCINCVKCFLHFLHSIFKSSEHLYYHYSEFFFRKIVHFLFIYLVLMVQNSLNFCLSIKLCFTSTFSFICAVFLCLFIFFF